jgi:hypothetical protein
MRKLNELLPELGRIFAYDLERFREFPSVWTNIPY